MKKFYITIAILALLINLTAFLILDIKFIEFILFASVINLICVVIFLAFFFLLKKFQKTWLKIFTILINICLVIFLGFDYLSLWAVTDLFDTEPETPNPNNCYERLKERVHYPKGISHFPQNVPDEYKNAHCVIENDFHGYNIHFLKFDADKTVVNDVIKHNKENIDKKYEFKGIERYYQYLEGNSSFGINNEEDYFVYIMKNPYEEKEYVSGIIAPKENGTLIFFYANWNIKNTDFEKE